MARRGHECGVGGGVAGGCVGAGCVGGHCQLSPGQACPPTGGTVHMHPGPGWALAVPSPPPKRIASPTPAASDDAQIVRLTFILIANSSVLGAGSPSQPD